MSCVITNRCCIAQLQFRHVFNNGTASSRLCTVPAMEQEFVKPKKYVKYLNMISVTAFECYNFFFFLIPNVLSYISDVATAKSLDVIYTC